MVVHYRRSVAYGTAVFIVKTHYFAVYENVSCHII